jgi:hypothetical protein
VPAPAQKCCSCRAVKSSFDFERVLPFDVSCTTAGLAAVAGATSSARYSMAAACSRLWFHGRNTAGQPVYKAQRDMVYDGIDKLQVSRNSGADSIIEGAAGTARLNVVPSRQPSG